MARLKLDASLGDAYLSFTPSGPAAAVGSHIIVDMDVVLPSATVAALISAGRSFSADWFELNITSGNLGGVFSRLVSGVPTQWNDWTPNAANGVLPEDITFHINFDIQYVSGTTWTTTTKIDGTTVDTFSHNFGFAPIGIRTWTDFRVGAIFAPHVSGEIYYIDNVVLVQDGITIFSDNFEDGTTDAWNSVTGNATIDGTGIGPTAPDNTDCASAEVLSGCSGTIVADNRGWAGTWPTGNDPLFNAIGHGGGAPLWYKWTNTQGRRLLFRVTISSPSDHPVDYNFGMNIAADCGSVVFIVDDSTLDIGLGPGCLIDNNLEGGTFDGYEVGDFFGPEFTTDFDIMVDPGHTVYFELDSYTNDASEPPTADSAHRGKFKFDWSALTFTTQDKMEGGGFDCEPHTSNLIDPVQVTDWRTDGSDTSHLITSWETLKVGSRLYLMWAYESDDNGTSWYAGDCALDGSDLHFQRYIDRHGAASQYPVLQTPKMVTNGTDVFIGFAWREFVSAYKNPGYTDSCGAHAGTTFFCFECDTGMSQWRFSFKKFNASGHTWDDLISVGENAPDPTWPASFPDFGDLSGFDSSFFTSAFCVTDTEIWLKTSYTPTRIDQSLHINDYPITETPPGAYWCTNDREYLSAVVDTFKFTLADIDGLGGGWSLESRDIVEVGEYQHWVSDSPHVNPAFSSWQTFADGNFITDPPGTAYPTNQINAMDMIGDEGYPILAYSHLLNTNTISDDVIVKRVDTGSVIQDWSYGDFNLGSDTSTKQAVNIHITPKYINPYNIVEHERGVRIVYNGGAIWLMRIKSDFTSGLSYVDPLNTGSSTPNIWPFYGQPLAFFPDKKLGQWWTTGSSTLSPFGSIFLYDLCGPRWSDVYDTIQDGYTTNNLTSRGSMYYDKIADTMTFLSDKNALKIADVLRDFVICEIGEPCTGCPPSILRFFKDGVWRQQNVDTEYSLWVFKDGVWIQDCTELQGHLEGTWQT